MSKKVVRMQLLPIVQAPMAGVSTPELAAAVSNAGGIGSLGLAGQTPANVKRLIMQTQQLTSRPININFFVFQQQLANFSKNKQWISSLGPLFEKSRIPPPSDLQPVYSPVSQEIIDILLDLRPFIVSFHFGCINNEWASQLRAAGIKLWVTATSTREAAEIHALEYDGIVLQGNEAGGHRGTFDPEAASDEHLGVLDLVAQTRAQLGDDVRLIAAGGIMDGNDIKAAIKAGANMVQLGTAFIACPESAASKEYRSRLQSSDPTLLHNLVSGRYARGFHNEFVDFCLESGVQPAPFPYAYDAQKQLAQDPRYTNQWAGEAHSRARLVPAAKLVELLVKESEILEISV